MSDHDNTASNPNNHNNQEEKVPKHRDKLVALDSLSLGISVVIAILIGIGIGIWMKNFFNQEWLLWLGVFWGVGGAAANIQKVYARQKREMDKLADDPKYKYQKYDDSE
jgi:F0F1-type ATP synthase assembly protein I